jgi:hypothetical protein
MPWHRDQVYKGSNFSNGSEHVLQIEAVKDANHDFWKAPGHF